MAKNYMKEVAQLLGVELEEIFYIKECGGAYTFTYDGLFFEDEVGKWQESAYLKELLMGELTIITNILRTKEKEYLNAVIKPFKDKIFGIAKHTLYTDKHEYLTISLTEETGDHFHMSLPSFTANTMYKGMTIDKQYSLEELDI